MLADYYKTLDSPASSVVDNPNRMNIPNQSRVVERHVYRPLPLMDGIQMRTLIHGSLEDVTIWSILRISNVGASKSKRRGHIILTEQYYAS